MPPQPGQRSAAPGRGAAAIIFRHPAFHADPTVYGRLVKLVMFSSTAATSVWQSRDREMDVLRIRIKKLKCDPFKLLKRAWECWRGTSVSRSRFHTAMFARVLLSALALQSAAAWTLSQPPRTLTRTVRGSTPVDEPLEAEPANGEEHTERRALDDVASEAVGEAVAGARAQRAEEVRLQRRRRPPRLLRVGNCGSAGFR